MPLSLLPKPSAVASQLWRIPLRCSTTRVLAERKDSSGCKTIHTETRSEALEATVESRLPPDVFHRTASRHALRAILRECTYFPDQFAASWLRQHAISRFRTYEKRNKGHIWDEAYEKRLETVRRKSRQAMYQLQRANEGDRKMLLKALSMAYGRIGKRRRELVQELLAPEENRIDELVSTGALLPQQLDTLLTPRSSLREPSTRATTPDAQIANKRAQGRVKTKVKAYLNDLPAQLRTLVQSQIAASPPPIARRNPRRLGVDIPELNTWYKPMPDVRVKNKLNEWYASLLETVQPPLPNKEWQYLRKLALGDNQAQICIRRRTQLTPPPSVLELVVSRGKLPDRLFRKDHAHNITPRFMQRLWAEVFSQCPLMKCDSNTGAGKWVVVWGHHVVQDVKRKRGETTDANTLVNTVNGTTT
jgi:hypothetical protein